MSEKETLIKRLIEEGYLKTPSLIKAMKKVKRELFMSKEYRKYAYVDKPFPIPPFTAQTISAPHMYAITYEALMLKKGERFLEIGTGSGYGAALAREIVGKNGVVVSIEIQKETYEFAKENLRKAGYKDIILVNGDGKEGYPPYAPYDKICVTAAASSVPEALINQLKDEGKLIIPLGTHESAQRLVLLEKSKNKIKQKFITYVAYVPLI